MIRRHTINTEEELKRRLREEWNALTYEECNKLARSLPRRISAVLKKLDPLVNMASNADSCDSCKDSFVVNSKYIEGSICEGRYHTVCVSVKDSWLKLFSDWVNFSWSCDKCILQSQSRGQQLASEIAALKKEIEFLTHEKNLSSKMIEQLEYTNNLQKSVIDSHQQQAAHSKMNSVMLPSRSTTSATLSFSDAVKKIPNRSSVLLIKSDSNSGNNDILRDVTTSVNPAKINVCINNTHKIRNGIAVHCQDEKPPRGSLDVAVSILDNTLSILAPSNECILVLGDLNVNFFIDNKINQCFQSYSLHQLLNEPTRIIDHSSTLLDPVFFNCAQRCSKVGTFTVNFSDHQAVFCHISCKNNKPPPRLITFRDYRNCDLTSFDDDLFSVNWAE
ncbi:unnamed protein product [Acanthoscelides obtectus]|uniref:Endonuclease/exonuclease/phosphatase domain-containing protein n=1 Tax=Acanthoscelides obtectus TaxID=200917 RepID=A0A9P0KQS7_ACAOB|nr:unnamed protein product [Acanthoscelides obtectus]CAK1638187.1 hypothetical protein AOBTE_LOCUS10440 [Acanthoscelides obtectus]